MLLQRVSFILPNQEDQEVSVLFKMLQHGKMDSTFYERLYSKMTKGIFIELVRATPDKFRFSVKVPETITHGKKLCVQQGTMTD